MKARRAAVVDEYLEAGEAVLFAGGQVMTLSPLATAVWLALGADWTEAGVVASALVAGFDEPPGGGDGLELTCRTLETLAALRIVELA